MSATVSLRIDFPGGHRLGPGKIKLMEEIARTGSISAAARAIGMSYRRAWLLSEEINAAFHAPLIGRKPGGASGGGAWLTEEGKRAVTLYREAEESLLSAASAGLAELSGMAKAP